MTVVHPAGPAALDGSTTLPTSLVTPTFHRSVLVGEGARDDVVEAIRVESSGHVLVTADPGEVRDGMETLAVPPGSDFDLAVLADRVTLAGELSLPGRNVTLVAHDLTLDPARPAVVDVTGAAGATPDPLQIGALPGQVKVGNGGLQGSPRSVIDATMSPGYDHYELDMATGRDGDPGWNGPDHAEMDGREGGPGAPGQDGGTVVIAARTVIGDAVALTASGGAGGNGQIGQSGAKGGTGGSGGDAYWKTNGNGPWAASGGGAGGKGGRAGAGGPPGAGGRAGVVVLRVGSASAATFKPTATADTGTPGTQGAPGQPGLPGDKGAGGQPMAFTWGGAQGQWDLLAVPGTDGPPGTLGDIAPAPSSTVPVAGPGSGDPRAGTHETKVGATTAELAAFATPGWLQLMLEKIRVELLASDPGEDPTAYAAACDRLTWLFQTLQGLDAGLPADAPGKGTLAGLLHTAWGLHSNVAGGRGAFGLAPRWVPALSVQSYVTQARSAVTDLRPLEAQADEVFQALGVAQDAAASRTLLLQKADAEAAELDAQLGAVRADIATLGKAIDQAELGRKVAHDALLTTLVEVDSEIQSNFHLTGAELLSCLNTLGFMGEASPSSAAIGISAVGTAISQAASTVTDDLGTPVDTAYLLKPLQSLEGDDLKASLVKLADGTIDDSATYGYLAEIGQLRDLLSGFEQAFPGVVDALRGLSSYIEVLDQRNALVDQYNDAVRRCAALQGTKLARADQIKAMTGAVAAQGVPDLEPMASYANGLAEHLRWQCLQNLELAHRAASFWGLAPVTSMQDWLAGNPGTITADALGVAIDDIEQQLVDALGAVRRTPGAFPAPAMPGSPWLPAGVLVVLTRDAHPDVFRWLRLGGEALFELLPAGAGSTQPASADAPTAAVRATSVLAADKPLDTKRAGGPNPFAGKANVRLTKARVWLEGPGVSGTVTVTLTHKGTERFTTAAGPFPPDRHGARYLEHVPIAVPFTFDSHAYRFDPAHGFAAAALGVGIDNQDGDMQFPATGSTLPIDASYAPVGPFGLWSLAVRHKLNPRLDLSRLSRILIDFQGFAETFEDARGASA